MILLLLLLLLLALLLWVPVEPAGVIRSSATASITRVSSRRVPSSRSRQTRSSRRHLRVRRRHARREVMALRVPVPIPVPIGRRAVVIRIRLSSLFLRERELGVDGRERRAVGRIVDLVRVEVAVKGGAAAAPAEDERYC